MSEKHQLLNRFVPKEIVEALDEIKTDFDRKKADSDGKKADNEGKKIKRKRKMVLSMDDSEEDEIEELSEDESPKKSGGNRLNTNFECPICSCKKTSMSHLNVHIGTAHCREEVRKLVNKDTLSCNLCKKTFKLLHHVESHLLQRHQLLSQVLPSEILKKLEDMNGNSKKDNSLDFGNKKENKVRRAKVST